MKLAVQTDAQTSRGQRFIIARSGIALSTGEGWIGSACSLGRSWPRPKLEAQENA